MSDMWFEIKHGEKIETKMACRRDRICLHSPKGKARRKNVGDIYIREFKETCSDHDLVGTKEQGLVKCYPPENASCLLVCFAVVYCFKSLLPCP